jgi:DNA-binding beta-propeller fold protein YncE
MSLKPIGFIDLPENIQPGGFDHAAIHSQTNRLYVAHTINDSIDIIDCANDVYLSSVPDLTGVAGALVSEEMNLGFTSNRGENSIGIFTPLDEQALVKIPVGIHPNGLSFDSKRGYLLAANVGNPEIPGSFTVSMVDIQKRKMIHDVPVPGRTRWTIFDPRTREFFINIAHPAQIVTIAAGKPDRISRIIEIPAAGPHGLDLDASTGRLFCACDNGKLFSLDVTSGKIFGSTDLSGKPDVIFFNPARKHLYVAVGDPGVIDIFDTGTFIRLATVPTEKGTHTLGFDVKRNKVYAFLPQSHRAQIFVDN